jgi:hypothetical protein
MFRPCMPAGEQAVSCAAYGTGNGALPPERKVGAGCKDGGSGFVRGSGAGAEKIGRIGFTV